MNRGDLYTAPSGAVGRYVGERAGWSPDMGAVIVVAYEGDDFASMCAAFDRWAERSER
jgi:hypothetical protein